MTQNHAGAALPEVPVDFDVDLPSDLPFYYGSLSHLGVDHLVDPTEELRLLLKANGKYLEPALFDGKACVSCNYQRYLGDFTRSATVMQVIEFAIVAYPAADAARIPALSYAQYAQGEDQTGGYGFCRIHVVCNDDLWVRAGREAFGEPKFRTGFEVRVPAVNRNPGPPAHWTDTWSVTCTEDDGTASDGTAGDGTGRAIVTLRADLTGLVGHPASIAPFVQFGQERDGTPLAAPLNVFHPYQHYDLTVPAARQRVTLTPGPAAERIEDYLRLIDGVAPAGAWVFQSPPVAVQNRPYFVNTGDGTDRAR